MQLLQAPVAPELVVTGWAEVRRELKRSLSAPRLDLTGPGRPGPDEIPVAHPILRTQLDQALGRLVDSGRLTLDDSDAWRTAACLNGVHAVLTADSAAGGAVPDGRVRRAVERADRALGPVEVPLPGVPLNLLQAAVLDAARPGFETSTESRLGDLHDLRRLVALDQRVLAGLNQAAGQAERALAGRPGATLVSCTVGHLHDLIRFGAAGPTRCPACARAGERRLGRSLVRALGLLTCCWFAALATSRPARSVAAPLVAPRSPIDDVEPDDRLVSADALAARARTLWDTGRVRELRPLMGTLLTRTRELSPDERAEVGHLHSTLLWVLHHPAANQVLERELRALPADGGSPRRAVIRGRLEAELLFRTAVRGPVTGSLLDRLARSARRTEQLLAGLPEAHDQVALSRMSSAAAGLADPAPTLEQARLRLGAEQLAAATPEPGSWAAGWHGGVLTVLIARRARARRERPGDDVLEAARAHAEQTASPIHQITAACLEGRIAVLAGDRGATRTALARLAAHDLAGDDPLTTEVALLTSVIRDRARSTRGWNEVLADSVGLARCAGPGPGSIMLPTWLTPRTW